MFEGTEKMKHAFSYKIWIFFAALLLPLVAVDFSAVELPILVALNTAEAVVGRPASPTSVAGVKRRTRRRTARRVAVGTRVYSLPGGCTTVVKRQVTYHYCGGVYYRPYFEGNTVIYIVEEP